MYAYLSQTFDNCNATQCVLNRVLLKIPKSLLIFASEFRNRFGAVDPDRASHLTLIFQNFF